MDNEIVAQVRERMGELTTFMADVRKDLAGLTDRVEKLKQQALSRGVILASDASAPETRGQQFIASPQYKVFREQNQRRSGQVIMKAVAPLISPPFPVRPARVEPSPNVYAPLTLRELLRPISVGAGAIEYLRQKATTGTAGVQATQGTLKASVTVDFELATANVCTTAVWTKASRQVLDDDAQVSALVDDELWHLVDLAEELEILNGPAATAGRMEGLLTLAPIFTPTAGVSAIDNIGAAIGAIAALGYAVTATVLNPVDWTAMSQAKASTSGAYLIGNPGQGATPPYLWNVPVVQSANITAGTFLTGSFGRAAQLYDRQERAEVATENEDDFVKNLVTFLAERRSALVVRRPAGFLQGALVAAAP